MDKYNQLCFILKEIISSLKIRGVIDEQEYMFQIGRVDTLEAMCRIDTNRSV